MRHRIGNINTGLGNPKSCSLPNTWSENLKLNEVVKLMFDDVINLGAISEYGGFDFNVKIESGNLNIDFGYEPSYQYGKLLIYHIVNNKVDCSIEKGKSQGYYGSDIEITEDIKYNASDKGFNELIDKWHDKLLQCI